LTATIAAACIGGGPEYPGTEEGAAAIQPSAEEGTPAASTGATAAVTGTLGAAGTPAGAAGPSPTADPTVVAFIEAFRPPSKGRADALVTVYEVSDYLCPYCRQFATDTAARIDEAYVETGLIRFVYWDLPLSGHGWPAVIAAEAAHCAGEQGRYWEMHDTLFGNWRALADLDAAGTDANAEAAASEGVLAVAAKAGGVDQGDLAACVQSKRYRAVLGVLARQATDQFKVNATPTFLIVAGDRAETVTGFLPFEDLAPIIDRQIARAQGTPVADPTATPAAE